MSKEEQMLDPRRATKLSKLYIAFRQDPTNDQFEDSRFCSEHSISIEMLEALKTTDTLKSIAKTQFTDKQLRTSVDRILRQANALLVGDSRALPIKSLEGLMNAFTNLLKQQQLLHGKPTEIVRLEDLRKKPPEELHRFLLGKLNGLMARN